MAALVGKDIYMNYRRATFRKTNRGINARGHAIYVADCCTNITPGYSCAKQRVAFGPLFVWLAYIQQTVRKKVNNRSIFYLVRHIFENSKHIYARKLTVGMSTADKI